MILVPTIPRLHRQRPQNHLRQQVSRLALLYAAIGGGGRGGVIVVCPKSIPSSKRSALRGTWDSPTVHGSRIFGGQAMELGSSKSESDLVGWT